MATTRGKTELRIGSKVLTVNHGPMAFLAAVVIAAIACVVFLPSGKAELVLGPTGILVIVAQGAMRQAFKLEADPGVSDANPTEEGK